MIVHMVKKSSIKATLIGSLLALPIFANAQLPVPTVVSPTSHQTPSDESIIKLMDMQRFDKSIELQNQQAINNLQQSTASLFRGNTSSPEKTAKTQKILNDFIKDSMKELNSPTVKAQFKDNYISAIKAIYNQQEVNAMIEFYGSPLGQQIVKKQDDFNKNVMQRESSIIQHWQEDLIKNKMPKLFNELYQVEHTPNAK